ncbi:helix-turn-helix domain-containing protein [Cellulomonas triticagri]
MAIGERVHQLMWRQRVSQTALAPRIGMQQASLSRKLRGERPWFAEDLIAVAGALGVSVGFLFGEEMSPRQDGPDGGSTLPRLDSNQQPSD